MLSPSVANRAAHPPVTPALVKAMLDSLSPDMGHDDWVRVAMGVHSVCGSAGLDMFDEWSSGGETYSASAVRSTYRSVKPGPVGVGTLISMALASGFKFPDADESRHANGAEHSNHRRRTEERTREREGEDAEKAKRWATVAREAARHFKAAAETGESPYLTRKGVGAHGVRFKADGTLLVPMRDADGTLHNVQAIAPDKRSDGGPDKRFLPGRKSGLWHLIGIATDAPVILVAEGYATAATLHEATGRPVAVAFDAGNLIKVAPALRALYPGATILVCGDDDAKTEQRTGKNPGRRDANAAARAAGGNAAAVFPDGLELGGSDFNDLMQSAGAAAVCDLIEDAIERTINDAANDAAAPEPAAVPSIPMLCLADLRKASSLTSWLVKYVVPAVGIGMLFGANQTFKSFIALDFALHVAHGLPWLGRKTRKGKVIYIAAEGGTGLWKRIDAWHRDRGLQWQKADMHVVPAAVDLSQDAFRIVAKADELSVEPALVIVDTLSQTYAGEENSSNEMAAYLRTLGNAFRDLWKCAVLLIHHSGHAATERPRGSSAIAGNVDFLMGSHRDEKQMLATLSCLKQKDDERFADQTFSLRTFELGTDPDGDPVTSLVARHLSSDEEVREALAGEQAAGRTGRNQVLEGLVQNGMTEKSLRHAFYKELGELDADTKKKAFYRARDAAVQRGLIDIAEGFVIDLRGKR